MSIRRKHLKNISITQATDATSHSRVPGHNTSRKSKRLKRISSKKIRQFLQKEDTED